MNLLLVPADNKPPAEGSFSRPELALPNKHQATFVSKRAAIPLTPHYTVALITVAGRS
jgi:hypothetical protein